MIWASLFDVYYQEYKYKPHKLEKNHKKDFRGILLKQFVTQLRFVLGSSDKYKMIDNGMYRDILACINKQKTNKQTKNKRLLLPSI